ncbi:MAG: polysulfide reductase NrfD [Gammaproteobacteria bacterium]|nr:polysulfide reductase NrfD [Gammaproteobacteria bacterium]
MEHQVMWSWPVIGYLFLAGLGAGALAVSGIVVLWGPSGEFRHRAALIARLGAFIGPLPVMVGTSLLIFELGRPFRALNLLTSNFWFMVFNPSPMNWGSWFIVLFCIFATVYALSFIPWKALLRSELGERLEARGERARAPMAVVCVPLAIALAIYTAILLAAVPARPLWHTPVLWLLFTVSALSTGLSAIILVQRFMFRKEGARRREDHTYRVTEYYLVSMKVLLIIAEVVVIGLFFMFAHMTINSASFAVQSLLPGGELATAFWVGVILVGLVAPAFIEGFYLLRTAVLGHEFEWPYVINVSAPIAILFGGLMLRYVIVVGGQITGPIGI